MQVLGRVGLIQVLGAAQASGGRVIFFIFAVIFMYVGRKVGWALSRIVLAQASVSLSVVFSVIWGAAVAIAMCALLQWQSPNIVLRWIMGYALAGYVAIPNYALAQIPTDVDGRREAITTILSTIPLVFYVIAMCALVFSGLTFWVSSA